MQGFGRRIWWLIGLVLLVACGSSEPTAVPPTSLFTTTNDQQATPTLIPPPPTLQPLAPDLQSISDPYMPKIGNSGYDVDRYTLRLTLDPAQVFVTGTAVIEATTTQPALNQIALDFVGFDVTDVKVDGQPTSHQRADEKLIVDLPQALAQATPFTVLVSYQGEPTQRPSPYVRFTSHVGFHFPGDGTIFTFSEPDGARFWYPANDHPRDKARFRFELQVPTGLTAVANGQLIGQQTSANGNLFIWEHNYPMATYLALVAVGPYERLEEVSPGGIPIRHYVLPADKEEFVADTAITGEALDWMSVLFGAYPFEAFGYATSAVSGASLETQTMVLMSSELIGKRTAVHEMAHMWFGDWVSLDSWSQMWLKEGLATYIQKMWEFQDDRAAFEQEMLNLQAADQTGEQYPLNNPPPAQLLGYNTYVGGAVVIHELRQLVGDVAFINGLRLFVERYGGRTASTADFQAVMEEVSGQSLGEFFAERLN